MSFHNQYRPAGFGFLPTVTKYIILISAGMYLATIALQGMGIDLNSFFALHHHLAPDFKPHQFITYIFMHATQDPLTGRLDFTHILFNMLGVFIFGPVLENLWGPKRFLNFYLLCGLGAALAHYFILNYQVYADIDKISSFYSGNDLEQALMDYKYGLNGATIVGASGSLFGLLGAFGLLFPNTELLIYFLFPIKAKWLVIIYGGLELGLGLLNRTGDNVAHFAHIGGLIVGLVLVFIWRKDRKHFY